MCQLQMLENVLSYSPTNEWIEKAHSYIQLLEHGNLHKKQFTPGIDRTARVHPTALISECSYIGPGCNIGPFCKVANRTVLVGDIQLDYCADVYSAIILEKVVVAHSVCISHTIIGPQCNLAFSFVTATRHIYDKPIKVWLSPNLYYFSSSKHHGAVMMHGVRTAVHTSTMPGSTIAALSRILPHKFARGYHE